MTRLNSASIWYRLQKRSDAQSRTASESLLGPEREVFAEAMALTEECLHSVGATAPIADLVTMRKISLANHGFNLLWSAWDQALAGRYDAAANHQRSINEIPDFLGALLANPGLADEMGEIDVHTARRAMKNALEMGRPGTGKEWLRLKQREHKANQPLSHISLDAVNRGLAVYTHEGKKIMALRPGGLVAELNLKLTAIPLAASAVELFAAVAMALYDVSTVAALWGDRGHDFFGEVTATLKQELQAIDVPTEDVSEIIFAKSVVESE